VADTSRWAAQWGGGATTAFGVVERLTAAAMAEAAGMPATFVAPRLSPRGDDLGEFTTPRLLVCGDMWPPLTAIKAALLESGVGPAIALVARPDAPGVMLTELGALSVIAAPTDTVNDPGCTDCNTRCGEPGALDTRTLPPPALPVIGSKNGVGVIGAAIRLGELGAWTVRGAPIAIVSMAGVNSTPLGTPSPGDKGADNGGTAAS